MRFPEKDASCTSQPNDLHYLFLNKTSMATSRAFYGLSMGFSWAFHGLSMGFPWTFHGLFVGFPWAFHRLSWESASFHGPSWKFQESAMEALRGRGTAEEHSFYLFFSDTSRQKSVHLGHSQLLTVAEGGVPWKFHWIWWKKNVTLHGTLIALNLHGYRTYCFSGTSSKLP